MSAEDDAATAATAAASEAALEVVGLSKSYGVHDAVRAIDLVVRPGEIHGLLGPNGAGKTTLLRMLLGLATPDAGTVRLLHKPAAGFVDAPKFYPYLTGRRNLELLARLDGTAQNKADYAALIAKALVDVGLPNTAADAEVRAYSAGMCQRLGFASALLRAPKLLLLDEPTSSLDPAVARDMRDHVRRLANSGAAILLSSHDMREVEELCSRVTILSKGDVIFSGSLDDLRKRAPAAIHTLSTSDNDRALTIAETQRDVEATTASTAKGGRLDVAASSEEALDRYVIALGQAGIAVRALESHHRSLESLFLALTTKNDASAKPSRERASIAKTNHVTVMHARGVRDVARVELAKLASQSKVWIALAACFVGPFAFVAALKLQSTLPEDTLFGRSAKTSGFAVPLVVLGFVAQWALPVLMSIVSGDLFASEDRYGTWPTLLTRSRTRSEIFAGKTLTAITFALATVLTLAVSSILAGTLLIGTTAPLISLSGTELSPHDSLVAVALAWLSVLPPAFGFAGLAMLISVATRSSAAGIGLPVLAGLAMQLTSFVNGGPEILRRAMLTTPLGSWHGLLADPPFFQPLREGIGISILYLVVSVVIAHVLFHRRDMGS